MAWLGWAPCGAIVLLAAAMPVEHNRADQLNAAVALYQALGGGWAARAAATSQPP